MRRTALLAAGLAAAIVEIAAPNGARAQCRLCSDPVAIAGTPSETSAVSLEIEASLDFDRLILLSAGDGAATLRPDGSRAVSGTVGAISARAMVGQARVRGEPGRLVRIDLPRRIELHSVGGGSLSLEEVTSDLPALPRLDPTGSLTFRFGGRLRVSGGAEGEYRGDVPITVEYL